MRVVFNDALDALARNRKLVEDMNFINLTVSGLTDSYKEALRKFEAGEINKVVLKLHDLSQ